MYCRRTSLMRACIFFCFKSFAVVQVENFTRPRRTVSTLVHKDEVFTHSSFQEMNLFLITPLLSRGGDVMEKLHMHARFSFHALLFCVCNVQLSRWCDTIRCGSAVFGGRTLCYYAQHKIPHAYVHISIYRRTLLINLSKSFNKNLFCFFAHIYLYTRNIPSRHIVILKVQILWWWWWTRQTCRKQENMVSS